MVVSCSGQWLKCTNPVIAKHEAKVCMESSVGAPMSVPHIDSRMIDGQKASFFVPIHDFPKNGSNLLSIKIIFIR
jgi:malate dehydrogenase (quinone)